MTDARDTSKPPMVVFDVMPANQPDVFAKAYDLTDRSRLQALKRNPHGREVVILAGEFTTLPIRPIATDIEFICSFGIRLIAAYQSGASLRRVYGEARAESQKANCSHLYFSVNDLKSAKEISERIGEHTIKTESYGFSSEQQPSRNIGKSGQCLLPPEELFSRGRDQAILMVPGMRPVKLRTVPWFEIDPIKNLRVKTGARFLWRWPPAQLLMSGGIRCQLQSVKKCYVRSFATVSWSRSFQIARMGPRDPFDGTEVKRMRWNDGCHGIGKKKTAE